METKPTRRARTQMINEYKEFLEYTTEYTEGQKGGSTWGRLPNDCIFDGTGLGRALTIIARGFLYHEFDENGNISITYEKENITPEHCKKTENYLMYWLTGDETYINSLPEKSPFKPYSFKQYLEDVKTDSEKKLKSINGDAGAEVNNNKAAYKKDEEKIKQYIDDKHQEKVNELLKLIKNYSCEYIVEEPVESEGREDEKLEKEQIISILDTLLKKGTKKAEADREDFEKLKNFFNCENPEIENNYDSNYKLLKELIVKHKVTYVKKNNEKNIILKTINALSKKIPDDKSEDRVKVKSLSDYFDSNEEKTGLHYHLYNRFFFCTQYTNPFTYGKNFNFKSVILSAFHEGPLSTTENFAVSYNVINLMIEAMKNSTGYRQCFVVDWISLLYVAAYCKKKLLCAEMTKEKKSDFQDTSTSEYSDYVVINLSLFKSWLRCENKCFSKLCNCPFPYVADGGNTNKVFAYELKYGPKSNQITKISILKDLIEGIEFINEDINDSDKYLVLQDCGILSKAIAQAQLNEYYVKYVVFKTVAALKEKAEKGKDKIFKSKKPKKDKTKKEIVNNVLKIKDIAENNDKMSQNISENVFSNELRAKAKKLCDEKIETIKTDLETIYKSAEEKAKELIGEEYEKIYNEITSQTQPSTNE